MDLHVYRNAQDRRHDLRSQSRERGAVLAVNATTLTELIEKLTPDVRVATVAEQLLHIRQTNPDAHALYAFEAQQELHAAGVFDVNFMSAQRRCWLAASRVAEKSAAWLQRYARVVLHALYDLTEAEFALVGNIIELLPDGGMIVLFNTTANVKPTQFAEYTWQRFIKDESLAEKTFPEFCRPSSPNAALLERLFVFDAPSELLETRASLRILEAPGRYREVEAIGSEIADLLKRGESASEIAVVVRRIETYGEMIEDVFSRYRIPHSFETGVPLLRVPFIKYWFAVLDLVTSDRTRDALARVMASAYHEPRLSPETDVERELATFGYIDRRHLPASDLARRKNSPLTPELQRLESQLDIFEQERNSVGAFLAKLQPPRTLTPRDRQAWSALSEELESIDAAAGAITFLEFRTLATDIAALRTIDRLSGQSEAPGFSRVTIMSPRSLGHRDFRWIFAPGIADGEFPARAFANPLLPDALIETINATIRPRRLLTTRDRNRREPLYLFMLLDSARDRVTLTYPSATLEGEPLVPSIYIGEIARHFVSSPIERVDSDRAALEPGECFRKIAGAWRDGAIDDIGARELLGDDLVRRVALEQRGATRSDVGPGGVHTDRAWHPSELNTLAACPFVFLARHRLGLRTQELPDFEIPPMEIGKLAHEILREFYGTPVPAVESAAKIRMDDIIRRRLADADVSGQGSFSVFEPSLWKIRRRQLVAALEQYVRFAVKDAFDGYETLTEYLDNKLPAGQLGSILLGGRPDHVAVRRIGGRIEGIRVDDFKYSAASSATNKLLKDSFQIPLYAWLAARAVHADETTQIDGRYLLLRSPSTPVVSHAVDSATFEELQSRVESLVDKARAGHLHPDPADRQECNHCDYRRLCRMYGS